MAVFVAAFGVSCFTGSNAQGLPCNEDEDCGQGQSCVEGFCGGPPATTSASASGSSSSGVDSSSGGEEPSTGSSTGIPAGCGNGVVEQDLGEECDPGGGGDTADCDADCTAVMCGDGYTNIEAGEQCDDGNDNAVDDCTPECFETLFWDDMEVGPMMTGKWMPDIPEFDDGKGGMFSLSSGWVWSESLGVWLSGMYSAESGTAQIITQPITFPPDPGPGIDYELRFRHRMRFDGNPADTPTPVCSEPLFSDGGIIWIREGGMLRPAGPPPDSMPPMLDDDGGCVPQNPRYNEMMPRPVYGGNTLNQMFLPVSFPLPNVAGKTVELVFEVSYDCFNCWQDRVPMEDAGWAIDDIVVAPFPI